MRHASSRPRRTPRRFPATAVLQALESRQFLSVAPVTPAAADITGAPVIPAKQVELLNRGLIAMNRGGGNVYVGWRLLATDPANVAFNLYRSTNGGAAVKRNGQPITATTDFVDTGVNTAVGNAYFVRPVINGVEQPAGETFVLPAGATAKQHLSIPLQPPAPMTTPDGVVHTYQANDASVGDLDGDGEYEIILKWDSTPADTFAKTANMYLDAYKLDGRRLWRMDLGKNIKTGAQFMQFIVYDLDGDGRAAVARNTADGTISGTGQTIGDAARDWRNADGFVTTGPEYLTIFNGLTGGVLATTALSPARGNVTDWGDNYGHRSTTFNATVAYLDGQRPSLVFGRGIYHAMNGTGYPAKTQIVAWDWRGGQLKQRWTFTAVEGGANPVNPAYVGQGNHNVVVGDVDGDGRDEITWGAMAVDDNGQGLYTTGLGHGDALHLSDMDPGRPGLEVFDIHESPTEYNKNGIDAGGELRDARTGQLLLAIPGNGADVGRGVAMDIDPRPGYEMWTSASGSIYNVDGTIVAARPANMFINFGVWWDADLYRELLDDTTISDWNHATDGRVNFDLDPSSSGVWPPGMVSNNSTKSTPALSGDLLGDWREEVIWRKADNTELQIWTTTIPSATRIHTLMHDPQYRVQMATQQNYYNQPPNPGFFLGNGMAAPVAPNVYTAVPSAAPRFTYQAESATLAGGSFVETINAGFNAAGYVNFPTTGGSTQFDTIEGGGGGRATVSVRFALGGATPRTGRVVVNGVARDVTFPATGAFTAWSTLTFNADLNAGTANTIRFESTGQDLANLDQIEVTPATDTTAPAVTGSSFRYAASPLALTFTFNDDVGATLSPSDLSVVRLPTYETVTPAGYTYDPATRTATFTLAAPLADGDYRATLYRGGVTDRWGNPLAADGLTDFFTLAGDANHDRAVNFADLLTLAKNYNATGKTFAEGDFNYDGVVNFNDLLILAQAYNQTLPPAPTAAPAAVTLESVTSSVLRDDAAAPTFSTTRVPARSVARPKSPPRPRQA